MKKRVRFVGLLAIVTMMGIIMFQVYWVYNSYKTEKRNFYSSVNFSLGRSINTYLLGEVNPSIIFNVDPSSARTDSVIKRPRINNKSAGQRITIQVPASKTYSTNNSQVEFVAATLIAKNSNKPLKMTRLSSILKNELKKNNLPVSFTLRLLKNQKMLPEDRAAVFVGFSKDNDVVVADITNVNSYLLLRILVPALISLLLIILSAGSLFYMGIIIRRQMRLDTMKNDFFSNIAHELRTPIAILKSTHEALHKFGESANPETTSRYLQINTTILDKLENNVDRILDITRYEQGAKFVNIEGVDLKLLFDQVIGEFISYSQASIQYDLPASPYIYTDKYIIHTALTNLIDNAIKYADGEVAIKITAWFDNRHWYLEVKDNGIGIDQQYLPYLFDKFYRVPSGDVHDVKGYGLGLNYVKELILTINGDISVKSTLGVGTTFTIKFPLHG